MLTSNSDDYLLDDMGDSFDYNVIHISSDIEKTFKSIWRHSLVLIILGLILSMLGIIEVFFLPIILQKDSELHTVDFSFNNAFGFSLFGGILTLISGAVGLRSFVNRSMSIVKHMYAMVCVTCFILMNHLVIHLVIFCVGDMSHSEIQYYRVQLICHVISFVIGAFLLCFGLATCKLLWNRAR